MNFSSIDRSQKELISNRFCHEHMIEVKPIHFLLGEAAISEIRHPILEQVPHHWGHNKLLKSTKYSYINVLSMVGKASPRTYLQLEKHGNVYRSP